MRSLNLNSIGETGRFGEDIALEYLMSIGYELVGRNLVYFGKEIDIIVKDMKYIVFVEVKTRKRYLGHSNFGSAASAVNREKQQNIIFAAREFLKENPQRRIARFDVVEVYVQYTEQGPKIYKINHIPRAFGARR